MRGGTYRQRMRAVGRQDNVVRGRSRVQPGDNSQFGVVGKIFQPGEGLSLLGTQGRLRMLGKESIFVCAEPVKNALLVLACTQRSFALSVEAHHPAAVIVQVEP